MVKITKEEFDRTCPHYCNCPNREIIEWKESFRYNGISKYINGHQNKKNKITEEIYKLMDVRCCCPCNQLIPWNDYYRKQNYIPKYINGHNLIGKKQTQEHIENVRNKLVGRIVSEETKVKIREKRKLQINTKKGKKYGPSPLKGKKLTEEQKAKIYTQEHRKRLSELHRKDKHYNWKGGISYLPYCEKFDEPKKEEIRNKYDRKCVICNLDEKDNKFKNNKQIKLSVHHVDYDKQQGCNGKKWELVSLCHRCNSIVNHNREYWYKYILNKINLFNLYHLFKFLFS